MAKKEKVVEVVNAEVVNAEEIIEKIKKPDTIKDDEIFIEGKGLIKLKPTKLKHFKSGDYNNFMVIKSLGVNGLFQYPDGDDVIKKFISAALDIDVSQINFIDEMTTTTLLELIDKMNKINEVKETDFFTQLEKMGVMKEKE